MLSFEKSVLAGLGESPAGHQFLAAVSGGADSTAMLAALVSLREEAGFMLRCIHVEHGIRKAAESRGDAAFVKKLCKQFAVPCRIVHIAPGRIAEKAAREGCGIEAAAREYRHRIFRRELRLLEGGRARPEQDMAPVLLIAHTQDDLLETLLMRILNGSGPTGLAAMPERTPDIIGGKRGVIRRPLLALSRAEVVAYLQSRSIEWQTDSTNKDNNFFRNRVRNTLVPLLDREFPQWRSNVRFLGETQRLVAEMTHSAISATS